MKLATLLINHGISPNQISVASIGFAAAAAASMAASIGVLASLVAITFIQLRLVCNLLDGMVAIEGGKQSALGSLYNEFPDRIADSLLIVSLRWVCSGQSFAWLVCRARRCFDCLCAGVWRSARA
ncbi:CDP-alcohol phosphatidyltransferase family protein [Stutzerimonas stutzeri]|uniref:CDP-alcohol phosphatidyltransferase family protein n=1 Tax=Stutzerimonas stutzeri TaxID=316 RepID=UPI000A58EE53|nr:CDP-alcohol phosphatidyltransferase family protein [Stutzerimonas stutzeri]